MTIATVFALSGCKAKNTKFDEGIKNISHVNDED
jgi:hypothetical protein